MSTSDLAAISLTLDAGQFPFNDYKAVVISVHDGDTCTLDVDFGFDEHRKMIIRWYGINAPELSTPEGQAALAFIQPYLPTGKAVVLTSYKDKFDKYGGRYDGVITADGINLNDLMVSSGHAVVYLP